MARSVVKMGNTAVGCDFCVDVASLFLVEVDFGFKDIDLLRSGFELCTVLVFLLLLVALLLLVFVFVKDLLVSVIKLLVKRELLRAKILNHVEQVSVPRNS